MTDTNENEGAFDPPQLVQAQAVIRDDFARQFEGLLTSAQMHTDPETAKYVECRLREASNAVWRALSMQ